MLEEAYPELYKETLIRTPSGEEYIMKTYIGTANTLRLPLDSKGHVVATEK